MAAAILGPDPAARLGLLAATAFSIGITPLGLYTSGNPILAMGHCTSPAGPGPRRPSAAGGSEPLASTALLALGLARSRTEHPVISSAGLSEARVKIADVSR